MSQPVLKIFNPEVEDGVQHVPVNSGRQHRVLVVDDEDLILAGVEETLRHEGYEIRTAPDARQALQMLSQETFAAVLADHRLPQMTGLELLAQAKLIQPHSSRLLMTGVVNLNTVVEAINKGEIYRFIVKPWSREELLITLKHGVQRYELLCRNQELQRTTLAMNEQLAALNRCLEEKVKLEALHNHQLGELNRALSHNFQSAVGIGFQVFQTLCPNLGRQARRVHQLCHLMAAELRLPDDQWEILENSAWLYDIGLAGIPADLVRRWQRNPEDASDAEIELLEHHPVISQELASFVYQLAEVGRVVRAHHERFDGKGFPDGLAGEEIPWLARLLAVATAFAAGPDAREQAWARIAGQAHSAFDPEAVRILERCLDLLPKARPWKTVPLTSLKPGMTLAEDIFSPQGCLMAAQGQTLSEGCITRLLRYHRIQPLLDSLAVYQDP